MDTIAVFKALSDETRLRLMALLLEHELNVNEIVHIMDMGQSRISRHLKIMTDAGLLQSRRNGMWIFYSAASDGEARRFLDAARFMIREFPEDLTAAEVVIAERARQSVRFFDEIAGQWCEKCDAVLSGFDLRSRIIKGIAEVETAADLGCGSGYLLPALSERARHVIGIDRSQRMLEEARKLHAGVHPDLRIGDIEHLPMRDSEADLAVINMVLHHLHTPADGIREGYRVLKQGGRFVVAELLPHEKENMRNEFGDYWLGLSEKEIRKWMEEAGFRFEKSEEISLENGLRVGIFTGIKQ